MSPFPNKAWPGFGCPVCLRIRFRNEEFKRNVDKRQRDLERERSREDLEYTDSEDEDPDYMDAGTVRGKRQHINCFVDQALQRLRDDRSTKTAWMFRYDALEKKYDQYQRQHSHILSRLDEDKPLRKLVEDFARAREIK